MNGRHSAAAARIEGSKGFMKDLCAKYGVPTAKYRRFRDPVQARAYVAQLLRLKPPRYIGHNPLGGYMILAMLGTLVLIVLTGMMAVRGEGATIPLFGWTPHWLAGAAEEIHEVAGNLMMLLAAVHVGGVLVDGLLTRENLIAAMKKVQSPSPSGARAGPPR